MSATLSILRPSCTSSRFRVSVGRVCIKANQMPSVESQVCDAWRAKGHCRGGWFYRAKKSPAIGGACVGFCFLSTDLGDVCGLRAFLVLHNFGLDFVALGGRLENAAPDGAQMNE